MDSIKIREIYINSCKLKRVDFILHLLSFHSVRIYLTSFLLISVTLEDWIQVLNSLSSCISIEQIGIRLIKFKEEDKLSIATSQSKLFSKAGVISLNIS